MSASTEAYSGFRLLLFESLRREIFGPSPEDPDQIQSEELDVSPLQLYGTGVLFPRKVCQDTLEDVASEDGSPEALDVGDDPAQEPGTDTDVGTRRSRSSFDDGQEEQPLNLANEFSPSAMGITFRTSECEELSADVTFGTYERSKVTREHPLKGRKKRDGTDYPDTEEVPVYRRTPGRDQIKIRLDDGATAVQERPIADTADQLRLHVRVRKGSKPGERVVSLMLVNHNKGAGQGVIPEAQDAFYQVGISVRSAHGDPVFCRIDRDSGSMTESEQASMDLLYRGRQSFALGHGCAGDWQLSDSDSSRAEAVKAACLPCHEVKPVLPREDPHRVEGIDLAMRFLSDGNGGSEREVADAILNSLEALASDYESWINDMVLESEKLDPSFQKAASRHLAACRECLSRVREGIRVLSKHSEAMLSFRLANRTMLMQQHHSNAPARELGSPLSTIPQDYRPTEKVKGRWRPFQLAFIVMNIPGIYFKENEDRKVVDLIWFPTGGGKTEAYLGLSAFVICLRRLRGGASGGTSILMRYTLRLLTAQQFQRAAALILALEVLRQDNSLGANLGPEPISIGLWVGKSLSPNKRQDALAALKKLHRKKGSNPFQVLNCPWCGVEFDNASDLGYLSARSDSNQRTVAFRCPDRSCRWGSDDTRMPILVIDEDIYEAPPTLLLGTVDKFAQLSWLSETGRLFGVGLECSPPELIIQDELHLISGPLGTMVGLYETAIERLCTLEGQSPKIVASTATIRRAGDQCRALYGRESFEFPPQGLSAGDSYFAYEKLDAPGRLYVGVFASALKSHATAQVRTCSALLQGVLSVSASLDYDTAPFQDTYGTLVWYFNSLRELGHAATLCYGDIGEYIINICRRRSIEPDARRRIHELVELTGRRTADEIPRILKQLEVPWTTPAKKHTPVDVLLATNMISVGVDVPRLGLMVVTGQPKMTSEYIQATSRVGRRHPGLVVTIYNHAKTRDRSHYEQFIPYHQAAYRFVEPTSVTPFSPPARERGLRGLLVALTRLSAGARNPDQVAQVLERIHSEITAVLDRVDQVDPSESDDTAAELEEALEHWLKYLPPEYGVMAGGISTPTLMFAYGSKRHPEFQQKSWPVLTSMRSVDGTCEARVIDCYDVESKDTEPS